MNGNLQFDFQVDKANRKIYIKREFMASRELVWDCNTKAALLDQWFAPKPLVARTKWMNFTEGGTWLYVMIEPNGTTHWSLREFLMIRPIEFYSFRDCFSDEAGNINFDLPVTNWESYFKANNDKTLVEITASFKSLEDLEVLIEMGFRYGMKSTMEKLDELLLTL